MPRPERAKLSLRRRSPLAVESLESRQLLNAGPVTQHIAAVSHPFAVLHAEKLADLKAAHVAKLEAHALSTHHAHQMLLRRDILTPRHHHRASASALPGTVSKNDSPALGAYNPTQVRTAYGINLLPSTNQGQGVTVAIVDVYVDPTIQTDINTFSTQYGLPKMDGVGSDPKLTIVTQPGTPNSPADGSSSDTSLETALDVEWVHSIAPYANIVLVFAKSFSYSADGGTTGLLPAVQTGTGTAGVVATSVSYGGGEFSGEVGLEGSFFSTPTGSNTNAAAIAFSTGDGGSKSYPATSTNVLAVGGTALFLNSARGAYGFETAWGGVSGDGAGGGGVSSQYGPPAFQSGNGVSFTGRAVPDVSAIADLITGVSVYDSYDHAVFGSSWIKVGGTSLAAPVVSGMIALAQQNRIAASLPTLSSPQINAKLYAAYNSANYATYFHDITIGNNTLYNAAPGYDLATGIGSPKGNKFVTLLSS